jgi:hypothetical protein
MIKISLLFGRSFWLVLLFLLSCEKGNDRMVTYTITDSISGFEVRYLDASGKLTSDLVSTQSAQDVWNYTFASEDGGIVFVSANYDDPASAVKVLIYIDGKIYKQGSSRNDTASFVTISGVIPIRE